MTGSLGKYGLILIMVGSMINVAIETVKEAQFQADAEHIMLVVALQAELRNNTI